MCLFINGKLSLIPPPTKILNTTGEFSRHRRNLMGITSKTTMQNFGVGKARPIKYALDYYVIFLFSNFCL